MSAAVFIIAVEVISIVALVGGGLWIFKIGSRALSLRSERLVREGKWPAKKLEPQQPNPISVGESIGAFLSFIVALGVIFIACVVVVAVIKWAFQIVF